MIRNIVMVQLKAEADPEVIRTYQADLLALDVPGMIACRIGEDLGLREGNWSFAVIADFRDVDAYRAYDLDEQHNRLRALLADQAAQVARLQFESV
ncbi:MAG: Dabb family protein [Solirubrobacteraceae bacterium]